MKVKFTQSTLEEISSRLSLSEIIKRQVPLRNTGNAQYTGLCPFHKEKTPSFGVNDNKKLYHCFGCGASGNIFTFIEKTQNLPFVEVVKKLAAEAGVYLQPLNAKESDKDKKISTLYEVVELSCKWYEEQLLLSTNNAAMAYLQNRAVNLDVIKFFRLGYAPKTGLLTYLRSKNISDELIFQAGLLNKDKSGKLYEKFRNRIIFPIQDVRGRVIAFGGRILNEGFPKYLNSPETDIFKKGEVLFNEHNVRKQIGNSGKLVVVEGYMDVIALHKVGAKVAVAPLGTAITGLQLQKLWNIADEPIICLDGDNAGIKAMIRVTNLALPILKSGKTLKFTILPEEMDPDDIIKIHGPEELFRLLKNAQNLSQIIWRNEMSKYNMQVPEMKAKFFANIFQYVNEISDINVKKAYDAFFKQKIREIGQKNYKNKQYQINGRLSELSNLTVSNKEDDILSKEVALCLEIVNNPRLLYIDNILEEFNNIEFTDAVSNDIRDSVLELYFQNEQMPLNKEISKKELYQYIENLGLGNYIKQNSFLRHNIVENYTNEKYIKLRWNYFLKLYNLSRLKLECSSIEMQLTLESEKKVMFLRKQIEILEEEVKIMQNDFGNANLGLDANE